MIRWDEKGTNFTTAEEGSIYTFTTVSFFQCRWNSNP
jgi:hypothetical protein